MWWRASAKLLHGMGFRPRCSRTMVRCSPRTPARRTLRHRDRAVRPRDLHAPLDPLPSQTLGKVERFHQTLKRWLSRQPKAANVKELGAGIEWFRRYYNAERPHRAVGRRTPEEAFGARPKAGPSGTGLAIPGHYRVRQDRIDSGGVVTLRYNSRLHHIGVGRRHAGMKVLLLVADLQVRVLTQEGKLLPELTLDPNRGYQPLAKE